MSAQAHTPSADEIPEFFVFLADLIQLYALNDNPSILMLTSSAGTRASIAIADGRVIHAQVDELSGIDALHRILRWPKGELTRRHIRRSSVKSISDDLSTTLMSAYEHVMRLGVLDLDASSPPTLTSHSLEEHTSVPALDTSVHMTMTHATSYKHYARLVWGENLRKELKATEGFISFQLLDIEGNSHMRSTLLEPESRTLSEHMFNALKDSGVIKERLELYLTLCESYHAFLRLPVGTQLLYAVFTLEETTPAMVQFKLRHIIEKLPHPTPQT